jgi:adenylate cyclase
MSPSRTSPRSSSDILAALNDLLGDPDFKVSDRLKRFLRFVFEETLAGRQDRIKNYSIAVDVFGRPANFDGMVDPIVRVEACRLRLGLAKYYEGRTTAIQIVLPRGSYIPEFRETSQFGNPAAVSSGDCSQSHTSYPASGDSKLVSVDVRGDSDFRPPVLFVEQVEALTIDYPTELLARTLSQELLTALGQFDGITLFRQRDDQTLSSFMSANTTRSRYLLATKVRIVGRQAHLWWHLSNPPSMEVLWTATQSVALGSASDILVEAAIARKIAITISERHGLIKSLQAGLFSGIPAPGYASVLMAERSDSVDDTPERRAAILEALEKTVDIDPCYASAWAYLAIIRCDQIRNSFHGPHQHQETMASARNALRKAIDLAPHSATTYLASAIMTVIGNRFWEIGRFEEGVALTRRAMAIKEKPGPLDNLVTGFEAYRVRDYKKAIALFHDASDLGVALAQAGLLASCGQLGERKTAKPHIERLLTSRPNYACEMRDYFRNRNPSRTYIDSLADGLKKVGIPVSDPVR